MKHRKILCLLLAVVMLLSCAVACKEPMSPADAKHEKDALIENGACASGYRIIYPDGAGQDVIDLAFEVRDSIESATGVKLETATDFERAGTKFQRTDYEILIGETNRYESLALDGLLYRDFAVTYGSTRIAVYGKSVEALEKAVDWFSANCLDAKVKTLTVEKKLNHREAYDYSLKTFTINSVAIGNYEIYVNSADKETASVLQEAIANMCGYVLPIVTKRTDGKKAISVCIDETTGDDVKWNEYRFECLDDGNSTLNVGLRQLADTKELLQAFCTEVLHYQAAGKRYANGNETKLELTGTIKGELEMANINFEVADADFLQKYEVQATSMRNSILATKNTIDPTVYARGTVYYVSSTDGSDSNSGKSPASAWKTLLNVNDKKFKSGDVILFKRGDIFRGGIKAQTGVTYSSYGEGEKPRIYGSPENGTGVEKWTLMEGTTNIWVFYKELNDVGQIIFNDGASWAERVYYGYNPEYGYPTIYNKTDRLDIKTALDKNLKFFHCPDSSKNAAGVPIYGEGDFSNVGKLYLRCDEGNPGEIYPTIEFCTYAYCTQPYSYGHIIAVGYHVNNVTIDNLCLRYGSMHGVGGGDCAGLTVKNCEVGWIGGGIQYLISYENYKTLALGNGVEVTRDCRNYVVQNNWIYQCYDECITNQTTYNRDRVVENVTYTNNLMEYSVLGISIWMTGSADMPKDYGMKNIRVEGNMFRYIGYSCFYEQRPNKGVSGAIIGGDRPNGNDEVLIKNNVFQFSIKDGQMFRWLNTNEAGMPTWEGNVYINHYGYNYGRCEVVTGEEVTAQWIQNFNSHYWDESIVDVIRNELGDKTGIIAICFDKED